MKKFLLVIALLFFCFRCSYGQSGKLDSSFGTDGIVKTDLGYKVPTGTNITRVLLQLDNSAYVIFQTYSQTFITKTLPNGTIDPSYGKNGFSDPLYFSPGSAILQPDGKMLLVGSVNDDFAVSRINIDGSRDNTFSNDGLQTTTFDFDLPYDVAAKVAVQEDGKIVVLGFAYQNFALARYNTDGNLDTTFSNDGKLVTDMTGDGGAITIQNDGEIVIAGGLTEISNTPDFMVARFNNDGSMDSTFSEDGKQTTDFNSWLESAVLVTIQRDGKILVIGTVSHHFALARYDVHGNPDYTFGRGGKIITTFRGFENNDPSSVILQNDGKIIVAGFAEKEVGLSDFAIARYKTNGILDSSFSNDGLQTTDFDSLDNTSNSIAIQANGKIVLAGASSIHGLIARGTYCVARYNLNGSLDNTFDRNGKLTHSFTSKEAQTEYIGAAIQTNGKILAAGHTQKGIYEQEHFVIRYNTDGSIDSSFANKGRQVIELHIIALAIQTKDRILVASAKPLNEASYNILSRYNANGNLDSTFAGRGAMMLDFYTVTSIAIQGDGKIIVAGFGTEDGEFYSPKVARYDINGAIDSSFSNDGKQYIDLGSIDAIAIQSDGKILVGDAYVGDNNIRLARLNSDGTLDSSFANKGMQITSGSDDVTSIAFGNKGKIVVGSFNHNQNLSSFIGVYNSDGNPDNNFSDEGKLIRDFGDGTTNSQSVAVQSDGKIIVCTSAGSNLNSTGSISVITRYNSKGNLDSSFGNNGEIYPGNFNPKKIILDKNRLYGIGSGNNGPFAGGIFGAVGRYLIEGNKNKVPTVTLSIPYNIVKYAAPARIKLDATAIDEDGKIIKVKFYSGSTLLHTETTSPYGFLWDNVPSGNYALTVKAYDNSGNVTTSNNIQVSVVDENVAPVVSIVNPVNDTTYTGTATIYLVAKAKDPNDKISKVEFYNGTSILRTEYIYPYTYNWINVQPGTYIITAKAYNDKGLSATSKAVTVNVTNASIISRPFFVNDKNVLNVNSALSLILIPNPARNTLQVSTNGMRVNKPSMILVISATGVVMKTIHTKLSNQIVQLDVSTLARGVYIVKVASGKQVVYKQFVKL
ncbi:Ig-like domain-containing protein [Segetibacter koreensis]|uniref:Ig-like domain-containing protein n=1 Tax=Segetibacter koreensis TaxID=398037 RepID=UPI0003802DF1|nr:Ig-like domain-containing protein [Segetibacter koreensis]